MALQTALYATKAHGSAYKSILQCEQELFNKTYCDTLVFPHEFNVEARCDSSREVARLAYQAMADGKYSAWSPVRF